ncbi:MAG TPA: hypothetical protein VGK06_10405 [Methanosarcina sp.]|jgi:hypothetical protein
MSLQFIVQFFKILLSELAGSAYNQRNAFCAYIGPQAGYNVKSLISGIMRQESGFQTAALKKAFVGLLSRCKL